MDAGIKKAFEDAAKKLGVKIQFKDQYVFMEQECPAETKEELKQAQAECGVTPTQDPNKKCAIGDMSEIPNITDKPKIGDAIPNTRFQYKEIVTSGAFPGNKQYELDNLDKTLLNNSVYAIQQLEKFLQQTGGTGIITSTLRTPEYNVSQGFTRDSRHNTGFAIDLKPGGSPKALFIKLIDLWNSGALCGYQFIFEIDKASRDQGAIIHFDFGPKGQNDDGPLVGGKGAGRPYYPVKDQASLEDAITKRMADFSK